MLPVLELLLRHALTLVAYVRSLHVGAVVLLTAALLLPLAQIAELVRPLLHRTPRNGTAQSAPASVLAPSQDHGVDSDPDSGTQALSVLLVGAPPDLGAPHLAPAVGLHNRLEADASTPRVRKDLERGPPFFL